MKSDVGHLLSYHPYHPYLPPLLSPIKTAIKLLIHLVGLYKNMMEENTVRERRWQLIVDQ